MGEPVGHRRQGEKTDDEEDQEETDEPPFGLSSIHELSFSLNRFKCLKRNRL